MKNASCLDTGIITHFYSENPPEEIIRLMKGIKKGTIEGFLLYPIIVEVYYHMSKILGKIGAETRIASFFNNYPIKLIHLNKSLVLKAGELKSEYPNILSYNDCMIIAFSLNNKITLHTTEKNLHKILPNLRVKEYNF